LKKRYSAAGEVVLFLWEHRTYGYQHPPATESLVRATRPAAFLSAAMASSKYRSLYRERLVNLHRQLSLPLGRPYRLSPGPTGHCCLACTSLYYTLDKSSSSSLFCFSVLVHRLLRIPLLPAPQSCVSPVLIPSPNCFLSPPQEHRSVPHRKITRQVFRWYFLTFRGLAPQYGHSFGELVCS
jgi:hypothetical protein